MKPKSVLTPILILVSLVLGCVEKSDSEMEPASLDGAVPVSEMDTGDSSDDDDDDDDDGDGTGCEVPSGSIPDPGDDFAPLRWYDDGGYHGTPETAQKMGVVLDVPDYIQGGIDPDTGNHYFVFRTFEDQTEFYVNLFDKTSNIDAVRIFDGTGLMMGDEVEPTVVSSSVSAAWELVGDTVYVLNVSSPTGGFF